MREFSLNARVSTLFDQEALALNNTNVGNRFPIRRQKRVDAPLRNVEPTKRLIVEHHNTPVLQQSPREHGILKHLGRRVISVNLNDIIRTAL